jgi:hypothetical protein
MPKFMPVRTLGRKIGDATDATVGWLKRHPKTTHAAVGAGAFLGGGTLRERAIESWVPGTLKKEDKAFKKWMADDHRNFTRTETKGKAAHAKAVAALKKAKAGVKSTRPNRWNGLYPGHDKYMNQHTLTQYGFRSAAKSVGNYVKKVGRGINATVHEHPYGTAYVTGLAGLAGGVKLQEANNDRLIPGTNRRLERRQEQESQRALAKRMKTMRRFELDESGVVYCNSVPVGELILYGR